MDHRNLIEDRTIQVVPETERYGRGRDLFTMWFAANIHPLALVTGALASTVFGLSFFWGLLAVTVGLAVGAVLMALHSAQGPQLGLPQMIQSRGQFGSHGALLLVMITLAMYLGFFSSTIAVGGQALGLVWKGLGDRNGAVIAAVIGTIVAALGYRAIHVIGRIITVVSGGFMIMGGIWIIASEHLRGAVGGAGEFTSVGFFAMLGVGAIWNLAYGPYVSDYSRYMPSTYGGKRATFWSTFAGGFLGALLPMTLGVALGVLAHGGDVLGSATTVYGQAFGQIFLLGTSIVLVHINAMNLYGGVLCLVTAGQTFRQSWSPGAKTRATLAFTFALAAFIIASFMSSDLMGNFLNFINVLTYAMIPWSAINLADFYLVHRGRYDLSSIVAADGGIYGRLQGPAIVAYFIGLMVQVPFASMSFFTGPLAKSLGGVDIAWIVGFAVSAPVFLLLVRRYSSAGGDLSVGRQQATTDSLTTTGVTSLD